MSDIKETGHSGQRENFSALRAAHHLLSAKKAAGTEKQIPVVAGNIYYEELKSVAYHPDFHRLEAIFSTKQATGYGGNLCTAGSTAFVRFYLDYGTGWEDQGYVGVSEHDIPTAIDCSKHPEKPLSYAASLTINPKTNFCTHPVLPKVRAILEWNQIPTANDPSYLSNWGNTIDGYIQIKPRRKFWFEQSPILQDVLELAIHQPKLNLQQAAHLVVGGEQALQKTVASAELHNLQLHALLHLYKEHKQVSAGRFALLEIKQALASFDTGFVQQKIKEWDKLGVDWSAILQELENTKADISYEELESVGLDYNREEFVANFNIKRPYGYSGDLCTNGSLEYVAFWADWNNDCKWEYVGYTTVNVHDIHTIPKEGLSYSAILPYNFAEFRKKCTNPNVVKVRAVLSWNVHPSSTDADKLEYWGNRLDAYIQIKPGIAAGKPEAIFNIIGGIPVDEIVDATGLTTAGAKFALNQIAVHEGSPFGGVIVIQGPSFPGLRYRIKVTKTSTSASYYIGNDFVVMGFLPVSPYVQYTNVQADPVSFYYNYQTFDKNTDNVLARWSPGTNDLLKIDLEIEGQSGVFTQYIQMDNQAPQVLLQVNDGGDCTHFKKGDIITGSFYAYDKYLLSYSLTCSFDATVFSGNDNTLPALAPIPFNFTTSATATPCGSIYLVAYEKTIHDSQWTGNYTPASRIICLQK